MNKQSIEFSKEADAIAVATLLIQNDYTVVRKRIKKQGTSRQTYTVEYWKE